MTRAIGQHFGKGTAQSSSDDDVAVHAVTSGVFSSLGGAVKYGAVSLLDDNAVAPVSKVLTNKMTQRWFGRSVYHGIDEGFVIGTKTASQWGGLFLATTAAKGLDQSFVSMFTMLSDRHMAAGCGEGGE